MKIKLFLIAVLFSFIGFAQERNGIISGKVTDATTGEELPFVNISLFNDTTFISGTTTDLDGGYSFKKLAPGKYRLLFKYIGYTNVELKNIVVSGKEVSSITQMNPSQKSLEEVTIINSNKTNSKSGKKKELRSVGRFQKLKG